LFAQDLSLVEGRGVDVAMFFVPKYSLGLLYANSCYYYYLSAEEVMVFTPLFVKKMHLFSMLLLKKEFLNKIPLFSRVLLKNELLN
jgi:hypothetical protein